MTDQRELDRLLGAFFVEGTDELADRVIDAALDQIDHTHQRHAVRLPRRLQTMATFARIAAAAVIGVIAVGAALFLFQPGQPAVGVPGTTPGTSASPTPVQVFKTDLPRLTGPLGDGRQIHTATALVDGRVLVTGGYDNKDRALASAVVYEPVTDAFSPTGPLGVARGMHTATRLADGRVLIAGGGPASWSIGGAYLASAELFDPQAGTFIRTGTMTTTREDHTATLLADGRVLITGGDDAGSHAVVTAELYDPNTGTFSATGSMTTARGFHTATRLADGRVLIVGGDDAAWSSGPFLASAELYDPKTGTFHATGPMSVGRVHHTATLLEDGRVLVIGGAAEDGNKSLASAELFDPTTGTFSSTGSMTSPRVYQTTTLLSDGRVLSAGGLAQGRVYANNPRFLTTAELFDPTTGTFTATGSMADMRAYHTANLFGDGRVLIAAGAVDAGVTTLPTAELFDPKTGTFGPAGSGG